MAGPLALVGGDELHPGNEPQDALLASAAAGRSGVRDRHGRRTASPGARGRPRARVVRAGSTSTSSSCRCGTGRRRARATTAELAANGRFFYLVGGDPGIVPDVLLGSPVWDAVVSAWRGGAALAGIVRRGHGAGAWTLIRGRAPRGPSSVGTGTRSASCRTSAVLPHFASFGREWVTSALEGRPSDDVVLLGIDERTAAVWTDGSWRAMGDGEVTVVTVGGERVFASGDAIDGLPEPATS